MIAVFAGPHTDVFLDGIRRFVGDEPVVPWTDEEARQADVLAALAVEGGGVEEALSPAVRWVHLLSTGADGFPVAALGDRMLTASKGAGAVAIAEFVLASMLAFEKRLPEQWLTAPPARWFVPADGPMGGLEGKTLALVGVGGIGTEVARRALAFGVRVVACRRTAAPMPFEAMERAASLEEAAAEADHLVLCAPATSATDGLVGEAVLRTAKPGLHLVNVARGSLVDSAALLRALDEGRVAGASLDVADVEPVPEGHPFYAHPRVRLTPHIAYSSRRTTKRTVELFAENVRRYRAGHPLAGVVDVAAGY